MGTLFEQQEANRRASKRLMIGFVVFLAWLGFGGDIVWHLHSKAVAEYMISQGGTKGYIHIFPFIGILLTLGALGATAWAWRQGPVALIEAMDGLEIVIPKTSQELVLLNVVAEMSIAAGCKTPRVWVIPEDAPNAFATGTRPEDCHIGVTQGAIYDLTRDELQAVVAHEMGHIVNMDVKLMSLLTGLVGFVSLVNHVGRRMLRGSLQVSGRRGGGKKSGLVVILLVVWIISWLIAPLVTRYVAAKIGRVREFLADSMSAQFTRNPQALADALIKISQWNKAPLTVPKSSAALFISDPFHSPWDERIGWKADLMATHPPLRERVDRLTAMAGGRPVMCIDGEIRKLNEPREF